MFNPSTRLDHLMTRFDQIYTMAREQGATLAEALYMAGGTVAADRVGVTSVYEASIGEDLLTGRKLSTGERWFRGITGGISLITSAVGIASVGGSMLNAARGSCGGFIFRRCLVGDTQVVIGEGALGTTVALADASAEALQQAAMAVGATSLIVGLGGAALVERKRRKKRKADKKEEQRKMHEQALDELFGSGHVDDLFTPHDREVPHDQIAGFAPPYETRSSGCLPSPFSEPRVFVTALQLSPARHPCKGHG